MKKISIIVPCYNEEETIMIFYEEIIKIREKMKSVATFEYIFVNDGSQDKTLEILRELSKKDQDVLYISFSRNFGKEAAMIAGLEKSNGDYVAIMDVDLQDPPKLIIEMFDELENSEYDCIATRRVTRKGEPVIRSFFTRMFYKLINKISHTEIVDGARDFRMMKRDMVDAIISVKEYNRFSKGIFSWVGFDTKWLEYENVERVAGTTKWNFWKLFRYAIEGIVAYSTTPLVISAIVGIILFIISIVMIIVIIVRTLVFGDSTDGWPSLVCIILLLSGIQLFFLGIIGEYLSKTYLETKKRPMYIIKETEKKK